MRGICSLVEQSVTSSAKIEKYLAFDIYVALRGAVLKCSAKT